MIDLPDDLKKQLARLKLEDFDNNLEILTSIRAKILDSEANFPYEVSAAKLARCLYQRQIDENWKRAQCHSIAIQIQKMQAGKIPFLGIKATREFILDLSLFEQATGWIKWDRKITSANYFSSMDFFLNAKFAYTNDYRPITLNGRDFHFSTTPTLIRQAIELKIKNTMGLRSIYNETKGEPASIGISDLLRFLQSKPAITQLPVDIRILRSINSWSNGFLHSGVFSYSWQSLQAIDLIEPMFSIQNENMMHLEGFNYLHPDYSREALKRDLETFFSKKDRIRFDLYDHPIEGGRNSHSRKK